MQLNIQITVIHLQDEQGVYFGDAICFRRFYNGQKTHGPHFLYGSEDAERVVCPMCRYVCVSAMFKDINHEISKFSLMEPPLINMR